MKCGNLKPMLLKNCSEFAPKESKYDFKDGVCLKDGDMYGKIVYSDDKLLTVEVDNGNKYMKGQIVDFRFNAT